MEAESVRYAINTKQSPAHGIACVTTLHGFSLTENVDLKIDVHSKDFFNLYQEARFFNNDLKFSLKEAVEIIKTFRKFPLDLRRKEFEDIMLCRRRNIMGFDNSSVSLGIFYYLVIFFLMI